VVARGIDTADRKKLDLGADAPSSADVETDLMTDDSINTQVQDDGIETSHETMCMSYYVIL